MEPAARAPDTADGYAAPRSQNTRLRSSDARASRGTQLSSSRLAVCLGNLGRIAAERYRRVPYFLIIVWRKPRRLISKSMPSAKAWAAHFPMRSRGKKTIRSR